MQRAIAFAVAFIGILCICESEGHYHQAICRPGVKRYNKCRELCECSSDGRRWEKCVRQRKEFTTMSRRERRRYVEAVRTLSSKSCVYNNIFNQLITNHSILFMTKIHDEIHFLTWHRWYLLQYENLLRKINCRITVPYWDWSAASGDPWGTEEGDLWYSGSTGFGGNGDPANNYCINNGPFSGDWKPVPSVKPSCNRRRFYGNPPDYVAILELLETAPQNFSDFEFTLRVNFHNTMHCLIGGTMCSLDSSAAPEFFLHHCFVDKIWADWQNQSQDHKYAYFQALTVPLPGTGGVLPKAVVDNNNLLGNIRVDYLDINDTDTRDLNRRLRRLSRKMLRELKRNDFQDFDEDSMKLFHVKMKDRLKARRGGMKFRPRHKKDRRRMKSRRARRRGFDREDLEEIEKQDKHGRNRGRWRFGGRKGKKRPTRRRRRKGTKAPRKAATTETPGTTKAPRYGWKGSGMKSTSSAPNKIPITSPAGSDATSTAIRIYAAVEEVENHTNSPTKANPTEAPDLVVVYS